MDKYKFIVPVYNAQVVILKGDMKDIYQFFKYGTEPNEFDAFVTQRTDKEGYTTYYVCFNEGLKSHVIAHEVVHLVNAIFRDRYVKLDLNNDEPQAYLTGYLFEKILKYYYRNKDDKK